MDIDDVIVRVMIALDELVATLDGDWAAGAGDYAGSLGELDRHGLKGVTAEQLPGVVREHTLATGTPEEFRSEAYVQGVGKAHDAAKRVIQDQSSA